MIWRWVNSYSFKSMAAHRKSYEIWHIFSMNLWLWFQTFWSSSASHDTFSTKTWSKNKFYVLCTHILKTYFYCPQVFWIKSKRIWPHLVPHFLYFIIFSTDIECSPCLYTLMQVSRWHLIEKLQNCIYPLLFFPHGRPPSRRISRCVMKESGTRRA